jgi:hypothetical protein
MGKTTPARLRFEGETHDGEAMLETTELLFRGGRRLVIPLRDVKSAKADDGNLVIRFAGGQALLELGAEAAKWADKITNPKSVVEKLGVKPGLVVSIVQVDEASFVADLEAAGAKTSTGRVKKGSDAIFYGANKRADLDRLPTLKAALDAAGALWVIRPKGVKEITEGDVMAAGKAAGLVDVKVVRFSETHTAEKFVIPVAQRVRTSSRP